MSSTQRVALTGVGESPVGKTPDHDSMDLNATACRRAVEDAGLEKDDVDGVLSAYSMVHPELMHSAVLADRLGIQARMTSALRVGGATPFVGVCHAASAIRAGQCENVLVAFGDNRRTGWRRGSGASELAATVGHPEFEDPFGPLIPTQYAMIARRHMAEYGTTPEEMAAVSVACRGHAAERGEGHLTEPITVEDVLGSEVISDPLHKFECALVSDGAGAVVVSGEDAAEESRHPVELTGYGEGHGSEWLFRRDDLTASGAVESGETAFDMAGRRPEDVDVAQLYDCFTITVLVLLEDLGFCEKGGAGEFVREEGIRVGESLPVNTHGGELAYAGAGVFHILEAVRQVRGEGGATQVDDADVALAHGVGGILSTNATLLVEGW